MTLFTQAAAHQPARFVSLTAHKLQRYSRDFRLSNRLVLQSDPMVKGGLVLAIRLLPSDRRTRADARTNGNHRDARYIVFESTRRLTSASAAPTWGASAQPKAVPFALREESRLLRPQPSWKTKRAAEHSESRKTIPCPWECRCCQ
jgi:hypothetical protein